MAVIKAEYYRLNGISWDQYLFTTTADLVNDTNTTNKWSSQEEKNKISTYLKNFNTENKLLKLDGTGKIPVTLVPDLRYLPLGGGDMSGDINLAGNEIMNAGYIWGVDGQALSFSSSNGEGVVSLSNGYRTSIQLKNDLLDLGSKRITSLGDPAAPTDAATRQWVEQFVAQGTHVIGAVRVATTGIITPLSGVKKIDGVDLVDEDRVLLMGQTTASENGVYIVRTGKWDKLDTDSDKGSLAFVLEGSTNKSKQFYNNGTKWELFFAQVSYKAAKGGGLKTDGTGLNFLIDEKGIVNSMIADKTIEMGKIADLNPIMEVEGADSWATIQGWLGSKRSVEAAIIDTLKIIAKIRGATYLTNDQLEYGDQTIAGAYATAESKNRVYEGKALPPSDIIGKYRIGDIYLRDIRNT